LDAKMDASLVKLGIQKNVQNASLAILKKISFVRFHNHHISDVSKKENVMV
jgi:hypothetical protein